MNKIITCRDGKIIELKEEEISIDSNTIWVDIEEPKEEDYSFLREKFNFHELALDYCKNKSINSKFHDYEKYYFLIITSINKTSTIENIIYKPIYIFVGQKYIVTLHYSKSTVLSNLQSSIMEKPKILEAGSDFLLYNIIKDITERYFVVADKLEAEINFIEDELMDKPTKESLNKILEIKRKAIRLRKNIYKKREIMTSLLRVDNSIIKEENKLYFSDSYDYILMLFDVVEGNKEMIASTLDLYSSQLSNKTNDVMKLLTIITTIMMPITVVTGIYGMNFANMPELHFKYGYFIVWIIIIVSIILQLIYFKKKKWL